MSVDITKMTHAHTMAGNQARSQPYGFVCRRRVCISGN
jgi:hypothetical protein